MHQMITQIRYEMDKQHILFYCVIMIIEPSHHHHHESEEEPEIDEGVLGIFQSMLSHSQEDLNSKSSKVMQLSFVGNITIATILVRKGIPILL